MRATTTILVAATIACGLASPLAAAKRSAVIIGIDKYPTSGESRQGDRRFRDLEGSVNDAKAMEAILRNRYGFTDKEIHVLHDERATREAILRAIREHLVVGTDAGDLKVFYFSGHGSQLPSASTEEPDARDETIVPADSGAGAPDIRDKELRSAFNEVLDAGGELVAIFDSCHSASAARGYPPQIRNPRFLEPSKAVSDDSISTNGPPPEERGALILGAAAPHGVAGEIESAGKVWGLFTLALRDALAVSPRGESIDRVMRRVRGKLQALGVAQEPEIRASDARRKQGLLGEAERGDGAALVVAAAEASTDGREVVLLAGADLGLGKGTRLVSTESGKSSVRLEVEEVVSLTRSRASRVDEDSAKVDPGDLFRVERWAIPAQVDRLSLHVEPSGSTVEDVQELARVVFDLRGDAIELIHDPTAVAPDLVFTFRRGQWQVLRGAREVELLGALTPGQLAGAVRARAREGRIFIDLPAPAELVEKLRSAIPERIELMDDDDGRAHYRLVGTIAAAPSNVPEYAWVAPAAVAEDLRLLPALAGWVGLASSESIDAANTKLSQLASNAAELHRWLTMEPPPQADQYPFPYRLSIRSGDREIEPGGILRHGAPGYQALLVSDAKDLVTALADSGKHYVYLCHVGPNGKGTPLYPPPIGDRGLLPESNGEPPREILLPTKPSPLRFANDEGNELFLFITSKEPVLAPKCDFAALNSGSATRGPVASWSVERVLFRSRKADAISPVAD